MADGTHDSGVHRLPQLERGPGERRTDCATMHGPGGCLSRWVRSTWRAHQGGDGAEPECHCPPGCAGFARVPAHVAVELAHSYGTQHALAGIEEGDVEAEPAEARRERRAAAARAKYQGVR